MRELIFSDTFKMSRILKKIHFNIDDLAKPGETAREKGVKFFTYLIENICLAEDEITEFFASLFEIEKDEFSKKPIEEIYSQIFGNEKLISFFTKALQATKSK